MRKLSILTLAMASLVAAGSAGAVSGINSKYNIRGDRAIAPIQVFDDGQRMFLQLRRTDVPPVPIDNENGRPLSYIIDGPYMVIPALPASVSLRYGQREAVVLSTTRDLRPVPSAGLAPVPPGGGLYFGAAPAAKVTAPATDPVPASKPPVKQEPMFARAPTVGGSIETRVPPAAEVAPAAAVPSSRQLPDAVKGSFEVKKPEVAPVLPQSARGVSASTSKVTLDAVRVSFANDGTRLAASEVVKLSDFAQKHPGKLLTIEAPASATGEKRAAEVRRQLKRLGIADHKVSVEIGSSSVVQVLAEKG